MVYDAEVVITCGHKLPIFPVRVACVGCFCKGVFYLGKLFLVWLLSVGFKFWTFCWQSGFFILNLTTKEILKVFCSKDFKGIFLPKTFLPSAAAAALEIFCKKLLDRCKHPHRGRALKRDEYIWISQRAAEQIAETREAQEAGKENVRTEKLAGGFLFKIKWIFFFKIKSFTMDLF